MILAATLAVQGAFAARGAAAEPAAAAILAELRYTLLAGADYGMYHQIWALLAGVEFVHRWRTVGVGARLLLGVSGDLAYRWDYESTWHSGSPTPDQDRAEARLDFSVHFN
jgi:hypothetical protein